MFATLAILLHYGKGIAQGAEKSINWLNLQEFTLMKRRKEKTMVRKKGEMDLMIKLIIGTVVFILIWVIISL